MSEKKINFVLLNILGIIGKSYDPLNMHFYVFIAEGLV
jgi:hypothetical protein